MKKHLFFLFIAAAVVMGTTVSCTKDDNVLPEVIDSHVLDSGVDEKIASSTGSDGTTTLSYKSWIFVNQITRSGDNRFEVTLNGKLEKVTKEIVVENYNFGAGLAQQQYSLRENRREGYITIADSVLTYTVKHDNFSFSYELSYEVPVYDDGATRQVMPYYRYENITDKGYEIIDMESKAFDGKAYACKKYRHSIEVTLNREIYTVSAEISLMRYLGPSDQKYLLKSELLTAGTRPSPNYLTSEIQVKHGWSTGEVTTDTYKVDLGGYIESQSLGYVTISGYDNDLNHLSSNLGEKETDHLKDVETYVSCYRNRQTYTAVYNYFSVYVKIVSDQAFFDDGILQCVFPGAEITDIADNGYKFEFRNSGVDEDGEYDNYWMTHYVTAKFGETPIDGSALLQVVARR